MIKKLNTQKNVECFPRLFNRAKPDSTAFIDTEKNDELFYQHYVAEELVKEAKEDIIEEEK